VTTASTRYVLVQLENGKNIAEIARTTCWPVRQIHVLAGRYGFLISADGSPYKPAGKIERTEREWRGHRWAVSTLGQSLAAAPGPSARCTRPSGWTRRG
jgi:hypothetical protein